MRARRGVEMSGRWWWSRRLLLGSWTVDPAKRGAPGVPVVRAARPDSPGSCVSAAVCQGGRRWSSGSASSPSPSATSTPPGASTSTGSAGTAAMDVPGDVLMIQVGEHLLLSLWVEPHFEARGRPDPARRRASRRSRSPTTSRHDDEVDAVLATARAAGADPVHAAVEARVGRLHRLLRRPGRLPLGDRLQPRTDRTGGAAMSERRPKTSAPTDPRGRGRGLDDWRFFLMRLHARFATGSFVKGLELVTRIARGGRGGQPPPRRRSDATRRS